MVLKFKAIQVSTTFFCKFPLSVRVRSVLPGLRAGGLRMQEPYILNSSRNREGCSAEQNLFSVHQYFHISLLIISPVRCAVRTLIQSKAQQLSETLWNSHLRVRDASDTNGTN